MKNMLKEDTLAMLQEVLQDGLREVIQAYINDAPRRIDDMQQSVEALDLPSVEASAHALKGSSANIGAVVVSETADELVKMSRDQSLTVEHGKVVLGRLADEFEQTRTLLLQYI